MEEGKSSENVLQFYSVRLMGFWEYLTESSVASPRLYKFYINCMIVLLLFDTYIVYELMDLFFLGSYDFEVFFEKLAVYMAFLEASVKFTYYCFKKETLLDLSHLFQKDFLSCSKHDQKATDKIMSDSASATNSFARICYHSTYCAIIFWIMFPLLKCLLQSECTKLHVLPLNWPFDDTKQPNREIFFILESILILTSGKSLILVNCFFIVFAYCLCGQIELLNCAITNIRVNSINIVRQKMDIVRNTILNDEEIGTDSDEDIISKESLTRQMNACLHDCIQDHHKILRLSRIMEHMYNPLQLFQMIVSTTTLCLTGLLLIEPFQNSEAHPFSLAVIIKTVTFILFALTELLAYSWCGAYIVHQSISVHKALYNTEWVDQPQSFKKNVLIAMSCSQRPVKLTAGKFYTVDLSYFTGVVKASYSYFTVLYGLNSK